MSAYLLTVHVHDPSTGVTRIARFQMDSATFDEAAWARAFPDVSLLVEDMQRDQSTPPAKPL